MYPSINLKETGKNIKKKIEESGYSVEKLTTILGFSSKSNIYKWFRGESLPTIDNFFALSTILGVTINDLIIATV